MREKWDLKNNYKRGYLKIHVAVNVKTKKILATKVTDGEHMYMIVKHYLDWLMSHKIR